MTALFPDTGPQAERILIDLLRHAPVVHKLEMLGELNAAARFAAAVGADGHRGARRASVSPPLHTTNADTPALVPEHSAGSGVGPTEVRDYPGPLGRQARAGCTVDEAGRQLVGTATPALHQTSRIPRTGAGSGIAGQCGASAQLAHGQCAASPQGIASAIPYRPRRQD
jgi:hypothetical protein